MMAVSYVKLNPRPVSVSVCVYACLDDRQYTIDEQMVNRQMMSEIQPQRHQLLAALLFYCTGILLYK